MLVTLVLAACTDGPATTAPAPPAPKPAIPVAPGPLTGLLILSNPVFRPDPGTGASPRSVVYVSLPSATLALTSSVALLNVQTGNAAAPVNVLGGFDATPIPAVAGDTLIVRVSDASGTTTDTRVAVAGHHPPRVLRVAPRDGSIGVAFTASLIVVFSAPLNPTSVTGSALRLRHGTHNDTGTVTLDTSGTIIQFAPGSPLLPGTDYQLDVTQALADLAAEALAQVVTVAFRTLPPQSLLAGSLVVSNPVMRPQIGAAPLSVVYVSLPVATLLPASSVAIINLHTGSTSSLSNALGGFDPSPIPAIAGDTLVVRVIDQTGSVSYTPLVVSGNHPPRLLHITPANGSTDIALTTVMVVVFSAPLDPSTVTSGAIRLRHGTNVDYATPVLDTSGTIIRLIPVSPLLPNTDYGVDVTQGLADLTSAPVAAAIASTFSTVSGPEPVSDAVSSLLGVWQAVSWHFTDVDCCNGAIYDDPVVGWGPGNYYRIRLVVTASSATTIAWSWEESWVLGTTSGADMVAGSASVDASSLFGTIEQSPSLSNGPCDYGFDCPLEGYQDFQRQGDVLSITRRATLLYVDGTNYPWHASETVTLQRVGDMTGAAKSVSHPAPAATRKP